jgi:hypothetical protein
MPVLNGANYIEEALRSIACQVDEEMEVIVVDGGSADATIAVLKGFADRLPLRIFQCPNLKSWIAKTNFGLEQARGDLVSFLHHDDLWLADRIRVLRELVERHSAATMFLHPSWFIDGLGTKIGLWRCPLPPDVVEPRLLVERLLIQNFIAIPAPLFSRHAALRLGGLEEGLWYTADWDFWLKLAKQGPTIFYPHPLSAFRIHPQAQTMLGSSQVDDFRTQLEMVLARHLNGLDASGGANGQVSRVARFSVEVNTNLAALAHRRESHLASLSWQFIRLGPGGWQRYFRDSRVIERTLSRYRIGLGRLRAPTDPQVA